jgi:hypothetical protein
MLIDPSGNRRRKGPWPGDPTRIVEYLVEACDPCEHADYAYLVNEILVSDFYTPRYFDSAPQSGIQYSFRGSIQAPHQVLPGGYLSWFDPLEGNWWQQSGKDDPVKLGPVASNVRSLREAIAGLRADGRKGTQLSAKVLEERVGQRRDQAKAARQARAKRLRASIQVRSKLSLKNT